jgi:protein-disulfide isomerase
VRRPPIGNWMLNVCRTLFRFLVLTLFGWNLAAAQTHVLNYSGRISVDGKPFNGSGLFAFSVQDAIGSTLWASGDFPLEGATNSPLRISKLPVKDGHYTIRLGDPTLGMPPLELEALRRASAPKLCVWFNDGVRGWHRVGEDASLLEALRAADQAPISTAQADTILRELRELRALLDRPRGNTVIAAPGATAPPPGPELATVSIKGAPTLGRADAPFVLVEFTDFECRYCKQAHETAIAELKKKYVETGKVRLVMRNLALPFHPHAEPAAVAALCADAQQKFWPMCDKLFAMSSELNTANYLKAAQELKLDVAAFRACIEANTFLSRVKSDMQDAFAAGISSTPTFIFGHANGDQVTGEVFVGALTFAAFDENIQKRLSPK